MYNCSLCFFQIFSTVAVISTLTNFSTFCAPSLFRGEIPACYVFYDIQFINLSADFTVSFERSSLIVKFNHKSI